MNDSPRFGQSSDHDGQPIVDYMDPSNDRAKLLTRAAMRQIDLSASYDASEMMRKFQESGNAIYMSHQANAFDDDRPTS